MKIQGIVYDLDGTIINTGDINIKSRIYAAEKTNIELTKEHLTMQSAMPGMLFGQKVIPNDKSKQLKLLEYKR